MIGTTLSHGIALLTVGATAAVARSAVLPADASWWDVIVLGIPLGVLAASLAGSSARSLKEQAQPDKALPRRAVGTIVDGFIGGWGAMFLIGFSYTKPHFAGVPPMVLGAFGGLLTEFVRTNGSRWTEQLWQVVLSWLSRKKAPGDQTP